jgi:hypothetical protein
MSQLFKMSRGRAIYTEGSIEDLKTLVNGKEKSPRSRP